jgi:hypothetical protein
MFLGFAAGLVAGVVGMIVGAGGGLPRAMAQAGARQLLDPGPAGRYQISAWAHPGNGALLPSHGAYLLDTQTGRMWRIIDDGELRRVGGTQ